MGSHDARADAASEIHYDVSELRPSRAGGDADRRLPDPLRLQGLRSGLEAQARGLLRLLLLRRRSLPAGSSRERWLDVLRRKRGGAPQRPPIGPPLSTDVCLPGIAPSPIRAAFVPALAARSRVGTGRAGRGWRMGNHKRHWCRSIEDKGLPARSFPERIAARAIRARFVPRFVPPAPFRGAPQHRGGANR